MNTELAVIEDISEDKWPEVYGVGKVNDYYERVKSHVSKEVPDVTTDKGRKAIASLSGKVSSSKAAVEKPGRDYLRKIKELPKTIETELREFVILMDKLRDDTRQPLTDYEAEQKRIEQQKLAEEAAKALAIQIENDHEIGLLLNAEFDRKREEAAKAAEQARIEYEQRISKEAAERATHEAEERAAQAQRDSQLAIERAQREKAEAEARELQSKIDAEKAAERAKLAAEQAVKDAEVRQLAAIEAERQHAEDERLREEAEEEKRAANKNNQKRRNNEARDDLVKLGCTQELATSIVIGLATDKIRNCKISY